MFQSNVKLQNLYRKYIPKESTSNSVKNFLSQQKVDFHIH